MVVNAVSNLQLVSNGRSLLTKNRVNNSINNFEKADVSFKGYYSAKWDQRYIKPETLEKINKAAESSGAPKEFVHTLIGASRGAYFNPEYEEDFVFSPANIVDIVKAYTPEKQAAFEMLSDQEDDVLDEERFSGDEMRNMYLALNNNSSMSRLKELVDERLYTGYHKYSGNQIANLLKVDA